MGRLQRLAALAAIWLCALLAAAPEPAAAADVPYAGACRLSDAGGKSLYAGTCAVSRPPSEGPAACRFERFEVIIPGHGRADILRSLDPECPSRFRGDPVRFIATDSQGEMVVSAQSGAIFRFDPGPDATLPALDEFLRGMDSCDRAQQQVDFFERLRAGYPVASGDPEGAVAPRGPPILWPPGGFLAPEAVTARKTGEEVSLEIRLRGTYHGLALAKMRFVFGVGAGGFLDQSLIFEAPQARVQAEFGAMLALRQKELLREKGAGRWAAVAASEHGSFSCFFAD